MRIPVSLVVVGLLATGAVAQQDLDLGGGQSNGGQPFYNVAGNVIYDNGGPDGTGGIAAGNFAFGYREVADDFVLDPAYPFYDIEDVHWSYIWFTEPPVGLGSIVQVRFYEDDGTTKPVMDPFYDQIHQISNVTPTGNFYYGREERVYSVDFPSVIVPSDTPFWVSVVIMDPPENGFWLTSATDPYIRGGPIFVDYPQDGFPRWTPGIDVFGANYDVAFALTGVGIPGPGTLALLALGGLLARRRRR